MYRLLYVSWYNCTAQNTSNSYIYAADFASFPLLALNTQYTIEKYRTLTLSFTFAVFFFFLSCLDFLLAGSFGALSVNNKYTKTLNTKSIRLYRKENFHSSVLSSNQTSFSSLLCSETTLEEAWRKFLPRVL